MTAAPASTVNVAIRPITLQDVTPAYVAWLQDPEVNQYLETRFVPQTLESVASFVQRMIASSDEFLFAICADGRHVGNIKVGPVKSHHNVADVSLFVGDRSVWGKGVATRAISLVTRHAFEVLRLGKLGASLYASNIGSATAFRRAGYKQEGLRRQHYVLNGKRVDLLEFGITADDFAKERIS
ncbi:MAG: GNAT family N-acetyltransferase [Rhodospirillaceae bacterium]